MKTFQSKSLLESRTVGLFKGLTLLFLGASVAVLATYGLTIDPGINNATQYIQKIILTSDGSASGATGIVLNGNGDAYFKGNVGIGTGTPTARLDIVKPGRGNSSYLLKASVELGSGPRFYVMDGGDSYIGGRLGVGVEYSGNGAGLMVNGDSYLSGNVGIGTTSPQAKLDVNGTGRFTNDLLINGNVGIGIAEPQAALDVGGNIWNHGTDFMLGDSSNGRGNPGKARALVHNNNNVLTINYAGDFTGGVEIGGIMALPDGNVGIGKSPTTYALEVSGSVQADEYYYSSDKRLKKDIAPLNNALDKILALNGYSFVWKNTGKSAIGVIAQEVEKIFPELVSTDAEGYKAVQYGNLVAPLIESVKALNAKIDQQEKEIAELKNELGK